MARDLNRIFHKLPYPLRNLATTAVGMAKSRRKFAPPFAQKLEYLTRATGEQQLRDGRRMLTEFLQHAARLPRYAAYRGFGPERLAEIPIINRNDVRQHHDDFRGDPAYYTLSSSGSTGQPLSVPYTAEAYRTEYAFWWYHRRLWGLERGDRVARFAGHKIVPGDVDRPPFWVRDYWNNDVYFSSFHLSVRNIPHYVEALNRFQPRLLLGYPSSISQIAQHLQQAGKTLDYEPKAIVATSETLVDFQKEAMEAAFRAPVLNWYGNTEGCGHAAECTSRRIHLQPCHSWVRIVKPNGDEAGPGEDGRIIGTNTMNRAFPLINYDTFDMARVSADQTCRCGQGGLILDSILGRLEDYVWTANGRRIGRMGLILKGAVGIHCAQIEQRKPGAIVIRIERGAEYDERSEEKIRNEAVIRLGAETHITFDYDTRIERKPSGKLPFIIQHVRQEDV